MQPAITLTELLSATRTSLSLFWPEVFLGLSILFILCLDLAMDPPRKRRIIPWVSLGLVLITMGLAWNLIDVAPTGIFSGLLVVDPFSIYMKLFLGVAVILTILVSVRNREIEPYAVGEYYLLLLSLYFATMLLSSSVNLLMIMLSLEMVSITSYLLVAYRREEKRSVEAALKYIVFGAAASGAMLYAISWIYGLTGTLYLGEVARTLSQAQVSSGGWNLILLLLLAGIAFKVSAVPFHFWAPDAYQGAATPVTALLTVAPKAAGFAMLIRIFYHGFSRYIPETGSWEVLAGLQWPLMLAVVAVATMTWGNVVALWQKNIKRMLAYSSIGHAGYMLMGALTLSEEGLRAILFYFFAYMLMNMGAFFVVIAMSDAVADYEEIEAYRGIGARFPGLTLAMALFLLSLAGIPPLIGFFGKFFLFAAAIQAGWAWLAVIAVLNSVISLFYYVYVIKNMVVEPQKERVPVQFRWLPLRVVHVLGVLVLLMGILFAPVFRWAGRSGRLAAETTVTSHVRTPLPMHEKPVLARTINEVSRGH